MSDPHTMLWGALDAAEIGLPVFPLARRSKIPAWPKATGGRGFYDATVEPDSVIALWNHFPGANIAMRTGKQHTTSDWPLVEVDVIDIDSTEAHEHLRKVARENNDELRSPTVLTERGCHIWFAATGLRSWTGFVAGADFKGNDASSTLPPSIKDNDFRYSYASAFEDMSWLPSMPEWLRNVVTRRVSSVPVSTSSPLTDTRKKRYGESALQNALSRLASAVEGERNATLNSVSYSLGRLIPTGVLPQQLVLDALSAGAINLGLPLREAASTIASGLNAGQLQPRTLT